MAFAAPPKFSANILPRLFMGKKLFNAGRPRKSLFAEYSELLRKPRLSFYPVARWPIGWEGKT
jgi:hypothetical protein